MPARFGIDTPIVVRLATGDPMEGFEHCVRKPTTLTLDRKLGALPQVQRL